MGGENKGQGGGGWDKERIEWMREGSGVAGD